MTIYAQNFYEIPETVEQDDDLREQILGLVSDDPIQGKALEGGDRTAEFRRMLRSFFEGETDLEEIIDEISQSLPRSESPHRHDNRTFADGWDERLARTQISRFYNQAVLQRLDERGDEECFIPHSNREDPDSKCTLHLANSTVDIEILQDRLQRAYQNGDYHDQPMIPDHPHCTHVVTPADDI